MKVDPKRVEKVWDERCGMTQWQALSSSMHRTVVEVIEACHEPVELTDEDVGLCYEQLRGSRGGLSPWAHLSQHDKETYGKFASILRRYTPPSLPTKLARAIEALGPGHPEAVRILKEATDADG